MARGDLNISQSSQSTRGGTLSDRDVETAIVRLLSSKFGLSERNVQQIQELAGLRGLDDHGMRPRAAVRRQDLASLLRVPDMQSKPVNGAPTAADFNALRNDVRALFEALAIVVQATQGQ